MKSTVALALPRVVLFDTEGIEHGSHRADEAHGQQHQIGLEDLLAAGHFLTILPSFHSTRTVFRPVTLPFSPISSLVEMANSRSQPSSWLEEVRSLIGQ
jgi:hypothetical protein